MLQIYFQSGTFEGAQQSFRMDLLISFLGALIGIGGAYLIYWISINQIRQDRLKYIVSLLDSIIPSAARQAKYCKEHSSNIKATPLKISLLRLEANRDFKRLADKVDQEGVFHAFLTKYSRKKDTYQSFLKIYGFIDFLDYTLDELIKVNEKTQNAIWQRKKDYAITFREAKEKIESMLIDVNLKIEFPKLLQFLHETLDSYYSSNPEGENIVYSNSNLINPVRNYIMKNGPIIPSNTELMFILNDLTNQYQGMEMAASKYAEDYDELGNNLQNVANNLETSTAQLKEDYKLV